MDKMNCELLPLNYQKIERLEMLLHDGNQC